MSEAVNSDGIPFFTEIVEINDHVNIGRFMGGLAVALRTDAGWQMQRITAHEGKCLAETLRKLAFGA